MSNSGEKTALNLAAELVAEGRLDDARLREILTAGVAAADLERKRAAALWPLTPGQERARSLLGSHFVSPQEYAGVFRHTGKFTDDELAALATIPWTDEELLEEASAGGILMPHVARFTLERHVTVFGTNSKRSRPCFDYHVESRQNHAFLEGRPVIPTGWRLLRTSGVREAFYKNRNEQEQFIPPTHERVWLLEAVELAMVRCRKFGVKSPFGERNVMCQDVLNQRSFAVISDASPSWDEKAVYLGWEGWGTHMNRMLELYLSRKPNPR